MQILKSGSFLNLESAECVEALKFTARRLAEHTAEAVKENLNAQQVENLALQLWQKAEYVARETERRTLQQIFVEDFTERFRELKPDSKVSPIENADFLNQSFAPEQTVGSEAAAEKPALSAEQAPEITEKTDEFLGIVKSDESFDDTPEREADATEKQEVVQENIQSEHKIVSETIGIQTQTAETAISSSNQIEEKPEGTTDKTKAANSQSPERTASRKKDSSAANQTNQVSAQTKEPFEFGKCAVSLNLTLLASGGAGKNRKAIISAASHNLPPEIEFCEIADGEDLEQITELVKNKLARFRESLPVKYIEQLRAAKSKAVKRTEPTKPPVTVVPTQTGKKQPEPAQEKVQTATTITPPVNQQSAANEIQGSLF